MEFSPFLFGRLSGGEAFCQPEREKATETRRVNVLIARGLQLDCRGKLHYFWVGTVETRLNLFSGLYGSEKSYMAHTVHKLWHQP